MSTHDAMPAYVIVKGPSTEAVANVVCTMIHRGYVCQGGLVVTGGGIMVPMFFQAMVLAPPHTEPH